MRVFLAVEIRQRGAPEPTSLMFWLIRKCICYQWMSAFDRGIKRNSLGFGSVTASRVIVWAVRSSVESTARAAWRSAVALGSWRRWTAPLTPAKQRWGKGKGSRACCRQVCSQAAVEPQWCRKWCFSKMTCKGSQCFSVTCRGHPASADLIQHLAVFTPVKHNTIPRTMLVVKKQPRQIPAVPAVGFAGRLGP